MAKKVKTIIKLQIAAGQASPTPPVGPALGQHGLNIMAFCKEYNERTAAQSGAIVPVEITVYEDRSFTFITKTPPTTDLLKKAVGVEKGANAAGGNGSGTTGGNGGAGRDASAFRGESAGTTRYAGGGGGDGSTGGTGGVGGGGRGGSSPLAGSANTGGGGGNERAGGSGIVLVRFKN